jgi:demethylmenaquinone methyltransferase / 2-methoxy-6-polyprenyl-1,4-benzoquinol methylase
MNHFPPVGQSEGKKEKVEAMFDAIAPRYDLLNRVLSFGIDQRWRKRAVELLREESPDRILDIATGTADLAIGAMSLNPSKVVGIDLSEEMLERGREKVAARGFGDVITLRKGDCEKLPFSDNQFDAALVAFGVRNFENLHKGLAEINRVLRKDGLLVVLEFSQPRAFPIKQGYQLYSRHILPRIGGAISNDSGAYKYLPESVAAFPDGADFLAEMEQVGFRELQATPLTFGIASLYRGRK